MSQLDKIRNRHRNAIRNTATGRVMLGLIERVEAATSYIDRLLAGANSQQLMYLTRLRNILAGTDDGRPANDTKGGRNE